MITTNLLPTAVAAGYSGEHGIPANEVIGRYAEYFRLNAVAPPPSMMKGSAVYTENFPGHGNGPSWRPIIMLQNFGQYDKERLIVLAERPQTPKKSSTQSGSSISTYPLVYHRQPPYLVELRSPTYADVRNYMNALAQR